MSANQRIQWLHRKITEMSYPNAKRLAERFGISHRQAQRDVEFLQLRLGAPLAYDFKRRGYYYTEEFSLPIAVTTANSEEYNGVVATAPDLDSEPQADSTVIQLQLPYSAQIKVADRLTAVEMGGYITERISDNVYRCEFHSIEKFMSVIMSLEADITVLSPDWLRARLVRAAERIIRNNSVI
ncbi:MAG: WYL domain-containing protein [Eubacteriales bacterium]|nr:WYL domain-containing protein [Eubacteriales bacterium]MDY4897864.1 WYL domain-containing protein [Eubacteriales bacterium]